MAFQPITIRVGSASLNQTVYDFAVNTQNIFTAIDRAAADGADILALEELALSGYAADDYHQWNKDNDRVWLSVQAVAEYAARKNPNLVISMGAPWHYADKNQLANSPEYNLENLPYNVQMLITAGRVVAMSAKSILANSAAEYERRQFTHWPPTLGTVMVTLPDGARVPFGKPVVALRDGARSLTLTHEICADAWPGIAPDQEINFKELNEARHIVQLSEQQDLSIILNPSASKPEPALNKEAFRMNVLCKGASRYCGLYVYTNYLGSSSGLYAAEGSRIFAQGGEIIHHGRRYDFQDVSYSAVTVQLAPVQRIEADAEVAHVFAAAPAPATGGEADFDAAYRSGVITAEELKFEEYMRSAALWLRDYMRKQNFACQGYVISLSGGKDSAYGALAVSAMVELEVQDCGIDGFFAHFPWLSCRDEVMKMYAAQGQEAALWLIKQNLLTCVYLPTENSSDRTRRAAEFLINGREGRGIGGKFYVADVQAMLDEALVAYTGMKLDKIAAAQAEFLLSLRQREVLNDDEQQALVRSKIMRYIKDYITAAAPLPEFLCGAGVHPLPTWQHMENDILLQNIQARIRLPIPWTVANREGKIPLVTSNESEATLGYTTAGGDMHMGGANPIGGIPKHIITQSLLYFEKRGLCGLVPIPSLHAINLETPTAELRKQEDVTALQTDEEDLGFSYAQSGFIENWLITHRETPEQVFVRMLDSALFNGNPAECCDILVKFAVRRWPGSQFKRYMLPIAPHVGNNVDPHQSVRTTLLGDHFNTGCAQVTLEALKKILGGAVAFEKHFGIPLAVAQSRVVLDSAFKLRLIRTQISDLLAAQGNL